MLAPTTKPAPAAPYNPAPGTLVERVLLLLARNPEAEYSHKDLADELEAGSTGWLKTMKLAIEAGYCKYLPGEGVRDPGVWLAGARLAQWYAGWQLAAELAKAAPPPPPPARPRPRRPRWCTCSSPRASAAAAFRTCKCPMWPA
jgi:hypothetical protein